MGTKVEKNVADATEKVQVNVVLPSEGRKGAGFGKVVMLGAVPGILLGGAGVAAAAYATSDDFDDVVEDMKDAAEDILGLNKDAEDVVVAEEGAVEAETEVEAEVVEDELTIDEAVDAIVDEVAEEEVLEEDAVLLPEPLQVADVDDSMSFGEAFAAARAEVGPGGVFQWHGNNYSTYTKEEWDNMDEEDRGEYMEQYYRTDMSEFEEVVEDPTEAEIAASLDGREDVLVSHTTAVEVTVSEQETYTDPETGQQVIIEENVTVIDSDTIDVHAVSGEIDGHDAVYADVDEDGMADYKVVDMDDDGMVDADEVFDLHDGEVSMDAIGGGADDDVC